MKLIDKKKVLTDYKEWVEVVSEDLENKTFFTIEEIVNKVCELAEQQIKNKIDEKYN